MHEVSTYAQVVEKALAVESIVVGLQSAGEHGAQIVVPPLIGESKKESWKTYPVCARCKRRHLGECRAKTCFLCGITTSKNAFNKTKNVLSNIYHNTF